jgi:hypothetical protein
LAGTGAPGEGVVAEIQAGRLWVSCSGCFGRWVSLFRLFRLRRN